MKKWERFLRTPIGNPMHRSGFAFHSWQTPHAQEKCIAGTKARRVSESAELVDLLWDGEPKEHSLGHATSLALPDLR
jgi:hypothetical protein